MSGNNAGTKAIRLVTTQMGPTDRCVVVTMTMVWTYMRMSSEMWSSDTQMRTAESMRMRCMSKVRRCMSKVRRCMSKVGRCMSKVSFWSCPYNTMKATMSVLDWSIQRFVRMVVPIPMLCIPVFIDVTISKIG